MHWNSVLHGSWCHPDAEMLLWFASLGMTDHCYTPMMDLLLFQTMQNKLWYLIRNLDAGTHFPHPIVPFVLGLADPAGLLMCFFWCVSLGELRWQFYTCGNGRRPQSLFLIFLMSTYVLILISTRPKFRVQVLYIYIAVLCTYDVLWSNFHFYRSYL